MLSAFGAIAALLVSLLVLQDMQGDTTRRSVQLIQDNSVVSIELVSRIASDIERQRILIGSHIIESEPTRMVEIERQIAAARGDYAQAARRYAPLVTFPGEPEAWRQLTEDVAGVERDVEPALALSRANRDADAQKLVIALEPKFERIAADEAALVQINDAAAAGAVANVTRLQTSALRLRVLVTTAILVAILAVGLFLTRTIVRVHRQLLTSNLELENRNRELDAFAGRVAHDLRGPLNTISLATSLLAERMPDERATTTILGRGITQITNLIEDLLLLSRVGAMPTASSQTDAVAASLAEDLGQLVTQAGGVLRVELESAEVACSAGLLRQVLWNLGENAVKYRRPDLAPMVDVIGRTSRDGYAIRVHDNGLGMSDDDARRAFEPFSSQRQDASRRGDRARARDRPTDRGGEPRQRRGRIDAGVRHDVRADVPARARGRGRRRVAVSLVAWFSTLHRCAWSRRTSW